MFQRFFAQYIIGFAQFIFGLKFKLTIYISALATYTAHGGIISFPKAMSQKPV